MKRCALKHACIVTDCLSSLFPFSMFDQAFTKASFLLCVLLFCLKKNIGKVKNLFRSFCNGRDHFVLLHLQILYTITRYFLIFVSFFRDQNAICTKFFMSNLVKQVSQFYIFINTF